MLSSVSLSLSLSPPPSPLIQGRQGPVSALRYSQRPEVSTRDALSTARVLLLLLLYLCVCVLCEECSSFYSVAARLQSPTHPLPSVLSKFLSTHGPSTFLL